MKRTSKTHANMAMEELENAVIRQAESMGFEPGTDEFADLVMKKIIVPELRTIRQSTGKRAPIRTEQYLDQIDAKYVHSIALKRIGHWCKVNKGMNIGHAVQILHIDYDALLNYGRQSEIAGYGNFAKLLDGTEDYTYSSFWPDDIGDGCSRRGNHRSES